MSRKNLNGSKPGSIYRIALENFVTFKQVELYPGPSLNLIIGPNGTGKSTFVCAIVLGLCGKTSVIGRAKTIGEYVKSGHQQATIEIELHQKSGEDNVTITRNFNTDNNSVWSINNKQVKMKQVQDLIESLNIRVDNLCQLLPQDRVQDFAKMNSQELLKSTQIAVSGQDAVDQLDELIKTKVMHKDISSRLNQMNQNLQEQENINASMQTVIQSIQQRQKMEKNIKMCEKKRLWVEYENLKGRVDELNNDKEEANKLVKLHQSNMRPLEVVIEKTKEDITALENSKLSTSRQMTMLKNKIKHYNETSHLQNSKIAEIEAELEMKVTHHENKHRDIELAKATLSRMHNDKNNLLQQSGDESTLKQNMSDLHHPITKTNSTIDNMKQNKVQLQYELESKIIPQIRLCENRLRSLGDVANKRLEMLQNINEPTYQAVMWLRKNRDMFQGKICEPMLLEMNFKDPNLAKYVENTVPFRDLVAFTFESSSDMNLFLKKVRSEMRLNTVNAVCSPPTHVDYQPPLPISELRKYGFYTYLVNCVTAPDAIIRYLCKLYGIHRIPVGNADTYKMSQNVPMQIKFFFSENHRFTIRVSEYTGAKSTSTSEIRAARILVNSLDQDMLDKVQNDLSNAKALESDKRLSIRNVDQQISKLEDSVNALLSKRKKLHEALEQIKTISSRIRMQQNKIAALENEANIDIESEKIKCRQDVGKCVEKQCHLLSEVSEVFRGYQNKALNCLLVTTKLTVLRNFMLDKQRELRALKDNALNSEQLLERIVRQLTEFKNKAKEKLSEAKQETGNLLPHEKDFPFAKQFAKLPGDVNGLDSLINELQVKITCIGGADKEVLKEFGEREIQIKKLKINVQKSVEKCQELQVTMNKLRDKWLPSLESQIADIDKKFSEMFAQLGCAGEIKISKPAGDDEYDQYGISILVRFRSEEQLQVLSSFTQSGGERALSTALYLMALQQLSKVPFRCVDEVNQGMDPINERKMFQLLVNITSSMDASQYFLLTPKLLTNLKYTQSVKVHTIENGPKIVKYTKWNLTRFIDQAKAVIR